MERGTADEMDASMLGPRLMGDGSPTDLTFRHSVALRSLVLLAFLTSWAGVVAAVVLDGTADHWEAKDVVDELEPYEWRHATFDAAVACFLAAALCTTFVALCDWPRLAFALSLPPAVACVAKAAMLSAPAGSVRFWCAVAAAGSTGATALGCALQLVQWRRRRSALARVLSDVFGERHTHPLEAEAAEIGGAGYDDGKPGKTGKQSRGATFRRLIGLAYPERGLLSVGMVALGLSTASTMAMPALLGKLMSVVTQAATAQKAEAYKELGRITLLMTGIFTLGGVFTFFRGYCFTLAGERVVARLRRGLFTHIVGLEVGFFDKEKTGELMNRLSSDTTVLQSAVTLNVSMGLRFLAQALIGVGFIFFYSWSLSLVMLSVVPAIAIAAVLYARFIKKLGEAYQARLAESSNAAQEVFSSLRTVRSFAAERKEAVRYGEAVSAAYATGARRAYAYGGFAGGITLFGQYAIALVMWYGGLLVIRGQMSWADVTSFLLYTVFIAGGLGGVSSLFGSIMSALGASTRIFELLDRACAIPNTGGRVLRDMRGVLQLQDVSFAYPSRPDVLVLDRISLTVQPGMVVALAGHSGSGKSSIIQLIERFYDPNAGVILLDGVPLTSLDASWWRRQVALVAQEPVLFGMSIRDNITYGCAAATADAVTAAARTANAHEFVSSFPDGYDTLVGERGVQLSGGQKQRIAIARALLCDPKVLLLDEATSALDAESEHVVQEAIDRLMSSRTTVVVAHRLSTVRAADCICVISRGRIVERGCHDELIGLDGIYKKLVSRQLADPGSDPSGSEASPMASPSPARAIGTAD